MGNVLTLPAITLNHQPSSVLLNRTVLVSRPVDIELWHAACVTKEKLMCDLQPINQTEYCLKTEKTECLQNAPHPRQSLPYKSLTGDLQDSQFVLNHDQFVIPGNC